MHFLPPKKSATAKAAKPTPRRAKPGKRPPMPKMMAMPPAMKKAAKADPDMDGDAGANEAAVAEQREPASFYAPASRKSKPTVI